MDCLLILLRFRIRFSRRVVVASGRSRSVLVSQVLIERGLAHCGSAAQQLNPSGIKQVSKKKRSVMRSTYDIGNGTNNRQQERRQIELVDDVTSSANNNHED